jgi:hypothetical protein
MDKTIVKNPDLEQQQRETFRYWQSISPGDRLTAVSELSEAAYGMRGARLNDARSERTLLRFTRLPR